MTATASPFFEQPILNSPYAEPTRHHPLDSEGQPLNEPPREGRRKSELITPVPKPRKKKRRSPSKDQASLNLSGDDKLSSEEQEYNPTPIINEIRRHVGEWRRLKPAAWGVTPATARLLTYWRSHDFQGVRPFFCQVEAIETVIWLTEARTKRQYAHIWGHVLGANEQANPELLRVAMKMATGAGKTTVMAMLIAWHTVNAVRSPTSISFSRGFVVIAPGITIKDRLRVLLPSDIESYYRARELVPSDMLDEIKAKIVITNYHALGHREILEVTRSGARCSKAVTRLLRPKKLKARWCAAWPKN
jgi:type III restriction enzyme